MKHTPTHAQRAFTLIELLIVIAIIAILAAILFPVFARARENARRASCQSNMKQLGLGFAQYTQDYDERYPGAGAFQTWGQGGNWVKGTDLVELAKLSGSFAWESPATADTAGGALYPYVKSEQVYVCPSTPDARNKKLSYSMNCALSASSLAPITEVSSVVLLVDEDITLNDGYFWTRAAAVDRLTSSHLEGGNLLYADGHVKYAAFASNPAMFQSSPTGRGALTGSPRFLDPGLPNSGYGNCAS